MPKECCQEGFYYWDGNCPLEPAEQIACDLITVGFIEYLVNWKSALAAAQGLRMAVLAADLRRRTQIRKVGRELTRMYTNRLCAYSRGFAFIRGKKKAAQNRAALVSN